MGKIKDLTGMSFGRLKVISLSHKKGYSAYWQCLCECGNHKITSSVCLNFGKTKSCGCIVLENNKARAKHFEGGKKTKEYVSWTSMKGRCYNTNNPKYKYYGLRGINVCERWLDCYVNFLTDMGRAPSQKHSIDRIDNNGNYEPGNCRWALNIVQTNNSRRNLLVEYRNQTKSLANWCRELNLDPKRARQRIVRDGWSVERAFTST